MSIWPVSQKPIRIFGRNEQVKDMHNERLEKHDEIFFFLPGSAGLDFSDFSYDC